MYGNNFFNPFSYQGPYQASNLARSGANIAGNFARNNALTSTALSSAGKAGGLSNLLGKFSFTGFLNGASKTLNIINQAIPVFYQVKPIFNNAKTMLRVISAVKEDKPSFKQNTQNISTNVPVENNISNKNLKSTTQNIEIFKEENPTFFI